MCNNLKIIYKRLNFKMKVFISTVFILCLSSLFFLVKGDNNSDSIVLVHAVFRHGDRTPDTWSTYPLDPYKNESYSPYGQGQLTINGKRTAYQLGNFIKSRYSFLWNNGYNIDTVYARSTNFKRTKMTLLAVLGSMFPSVQDEEIDVGVQWQPISYIYESGHDVISDPSYFCLNYLDAYYSYLFTEEGQNIITQHESLYKTLSNLTGSYIKLPKQVCSLYGTLKAQLDWGLELPGWATDYYPDILLQSCYQQHQLLTATKTLKRLSGGLLLKKIIEDTKATINNKVTQDRKIYLYSTHDINISAMLRVMNVYYPHMPPYGTSLFYEIHKFGEDYKLKLVYKKPGSDLETLTIPGCDELCDIATVETLLQENIPKESDVCEFLNEI